MTAATASNAANGAVETAERASTPRKVCIALPGLNRVRRGAELAMESLATELIGRGHEVTLIGSGGESAVDGATVRKVGVVDRARFRGWPSLPPMRSEYVYEEFTFTPGLLREVWRGDYDVSVTCCYPWTNWALRSRRGLPHVFVTQNGDWPCQRRGREYRFFNCDGLVCTNKVYFETHREAYRSTLIPNGVDTSRFTPGDGDREALGWPTDRPVVLTCAALIPSKRVVEAVEVVSRLDEVHMVVLGDGPLKAEVEEAGQRLLGERFQRQTLKPTQMPDAYRSADALLHMSMDEPFGNIYIESMASGLPVVTHDWSSTRWIFDDAATLVDSTDLDGTAEALKAVLDGGGPMDAAALYVKADETYAWRAVGRRYEAFLEEVISA
ncbi:MAG: glycosyltransferase family 4 protein [Planctomycetota bacterium]